MSSNQAVNSTLLAHYFISCCCHTYWQEVDGNNFVSVPSIVGTHLLGVKRPGREADNSHIMQRLRI